MLTNLRQDIVHQLCACLDNAGIAYVIIGRCRDLGLLDKHDVDFVLGGVTLNQVHKIVFAVTSASNGAWEVIQRIQYESNGVFFVIRDNIKNTLVMIDICSDYIVNGVLFFSANYLLYKRKIGEFGLAYAWPRREFIYYLLKKIRKKELTAAHGQHLSRVWWSDPQGCVAELTDFFLPNQIRCIEQAACSGNWSYVQKQISVLRATLYSSLSLWSPLLLGREWLRCYNRIIIPTGLHLVFLGPDGSGKSSVISGVVASLSAAFRRHLIIHFRPGLLRRRRTDPVTDPHARLPRGKIISFIKIAYNLLDYWGGWLINIYPIKVQSGLVIFDRYFHDIFVDPRRYRYGGPVRLARLAGRLIPQPDLWIVLDAPAEVIQARKQEVESRESARQKEGYLALARDFDNVVIINAAQGLELVIADTNQAILSFMAERAKQRYAS